jgi:uncharacterized protein YbjT (DUF2867 family)
MILVTGATGLNGSAIVKEFSLNKAAVRALVRNRAKAGAIEILPGVEIVEGDMTRPETLGPALDGVDRALMISSSEPAMVSTGEFPVHPHARRNRGLSRELRPRLDAFAP